MKAYTFLIYMIMAIATAVSVAHADDGLGVGDSLQADGAEIDVTSIQTCDAGATSAMTARMDMMMTPDDLSCQMRDKVEGLFDGATAAITINAAYAACTVAGAPVSATLTLAAAATSVVSFIVKNLPCDDSANQAQTQAQIKTAVCDALIKQGIACTNN